MDKVDLHELENCLENCVYGYIMKHLPEMIKELKAARKVIAEVQANEDIYGDKRHCVEVALNKYNEATNGQG